MIIKKYTSIEDDKERKFSPFVIGTLIVVIVIVVFAVIAIVYKYFHNSSPEPANTATQSVKTQSSMEITPAGEDILSKLQKKVVDLNTENTSLQKELSSMKSQNEKQSNSISRLSRELRKLESEKKILLKEKTNQAVLVDDLKQEATKKQQELGALKNDLLKERDAVRKCQNNYADVYNKLQVISQQEDETLSKLLEQLKKSNKEVNALKNKNNQLEDRIRQLEKEIEDLNNPKPSNP